MMNSKKGNFGIVIGFMLSFFVIITIFTGSFYLYQEQISDQTDYLRNAEKINSLSSLKTSYAFTNPLYSGGRIFFTLDNSGEYPLDFKQDGVSCFDLFLGSTFFSSDEFQQYPDFLLSGDYYALESEETGVFAVQSQATSGTFKSISCNGVEYFYALDSQKLDWYDEDFSKRVSYKIQGSSFSDVYDYQVEVHLNSSIVDYSKFSLNDVRFVVPLKDYFVLQLPFDNVKQNLDEYSDFSFSTTLGSTAAVASDDPVVDTLSPLFDGLRFDGGDQVRVNSFDKLDSSKEATISFWAKPTSLSVGQSVISLPNIVDVEFGSSQTSGPSDIRVIWTHAAGTGTNRTFTNTLTQDTWQHIGITLQSGSTCLYVNGVVNSCVNDSLDNLSVSGSNLIIGNSFVGSLDEFQIYDIKLSALEILSLSQGKGFFKELDFFNYDSDSTLQTADYFVKMPKLRKSLNSSVYLYYDYKDESLTDNSDIVSTFSYDIPRTMGYVLNSRVAGTTGLSLLSLVDNNEIEIGSSSYTLNKQQGLSLGTAGLSISTQIGMKSLANVEGNGQSDDMITPISWAGTEFDFRGFRNGGDLFCMISPWGTANVEIFDGGVSEYTGTVTSTGSCITNDIVTANALTLTSDIPVLVSYSPAQDAFVLYPATTQELYGVPSQSFYLASGPLGATGTYEESDGTSTGFTLGAYGTTNKGGNGADGNSNGFKVISDNLIGAIQEADGDGSEATVFVPKKEFGTLFGSHIDTDYLAVVSDVSDASCTMYDNLGGVIGTVPTGTGSGVNEVYTYHFGVGNDNIYASADWMLECAKPVWAYYENRVDAGDETNLITQPMLRQYVYPEPQVFIV